MTGNEISVPPPAIAFTAPAPTAAAPHATYAHADSCVNPTAASPLAASFRETYCRGVHWTRIAAAVALCAVAARPASVSTAPAPPRPLDDAWGVDRVVDGDTIDISHDGVVLTVRLIGINAPEHDECWGSEAADKLREVVGEGPVWLDPGVTDQDQYGRLLRYVVDAEGHDAGAEM